MLKEWTDKVNGYGVLFRFITPFLTFLLTIISTMAFMALSDLKKDVECLKKSDTEMRHTMQIYNENHLSHHAKFEKAIENRLTRIETMLERVHQ